MPKPHKDEDEFAVIEAPERAVTRHGKGRPMKALLLKKWGANYAGQVLTNVEKGSIPASVARFYEDDEPTPNDVVKDPTPPGAPLDVKDDEMDPEQVDVASKAQADKLAAAAKQAVVDEKAAVAAAVEEKAVAKDKGKPAKRKK